MISESTITVDCRSVEVKEQVYYQCTGRALPRWSSPCLPRMGTRCKGSTYGMMEVASKRTTYTQAQSCTRSRRPQYSASTGCFQSSLLQSPVFHKSCPSGSRHRPHLAKVQRSRSQEQIGPRWQKVQKEATTS